MVPVLVMTETVFSTWFDGMSGNSVWGITASGMAQADAACRNGQHK